jgi:hypothetical protein
MFLGLLSFAAVREMDIRCEHDYLLLNGGGYLLYNTGERMAMNSRQCDLVMGNTQVRLPGSY